MKLTFDDQRWQQMQEDLNVAQLCGETAGKLYGFAKGSLQRATAAMVGEANVTPDEGGHTLELLKKLRNSVQDAAQGYLAAAALVDEQIRQLEPSTGRTRRRA